jgi:hypothetical protein
MPPSSSSPYRLLVEGPDDRHVVIHLLRRHGYDWDDARKIRPYIEECGGLEKLLDATPVTLKGTYPRLGIIVDANSDPDRRWRQLQERTRRAGLELPPRPAAEGTLVPGRKNSRVGVWLMPDNSTPGILETFLGRLIPEGDAIWTYAGEAATEARRRGAPCPAKYETKSELHTWLAWQAEPGLPPGTAIKAQMLRHDSPEALRFIAWFDRLFGES